MPLLKFIMLFSKKSMIINLRSEIINTCMELILRFLSIINLGVALSVPKIKPKKVLYFEEKASTKESSHGNGDSAGRESRQARSCSDGSHPPQFIDESTLHSCIHLYLYPLPPPHRTKSPLLVTQYLLLTATTDNSVLRSHFFKHLPTTISGLGKGQTVDVCLVQSFQEQGYTLDRFELSRQEKHGLYSTRVRVYFV